VAKILVTEGTSFIVIVIEEEPILSIGVLPSLSYVLTLKDWVGYLVLGFLSPINSNAISLLVEVSVYPFWKATSILMILMLLMIVS